MDEPVASAPTPAYSIGDLVWAKMKGFSPWPGRVSMPPPELRKTSKKVVNSQCIYFFGTNNYGWIEDVNVKPYQEFKEQLVKSSKNIKFKEACAQIEEFIVKPDWWQTKFDEIEAVQDPDEEFNKLKDGNGEAENEEPKKKPSTPKVKPPKRSSSTGVKPSTPRKRVKTSLNKSYTDPDTDSEVKSSMLSHTYVKKSSALLDRPSNTQRPETPPLNLENISDTLREKNINPSAKTFGFLGLGIMGSGMVKNLLNSGHKVVVWNRTAVKCKEFEKVGAHVAVTPSDVVEEADVTFSCVSDPQAAKEMVFGNCGVLHCPSLEGKGYVEMTSIDSDTSNDIVEALGNKGGRYLEAQVQGSKTQAEEGTLIILASGDRTLFDDCQSCFEAMSKNSFYLGDVGNASKMNSVLQLLAGVSLAAMAEGLALADRAGLNQQDLLDVLALTPLASPLLILKGRAMIESSYSTHQPLSHMQKDLKLALGLGDTLEQSLPLTATTNEIFKHAKRLGYSNHDVSAVYIRARF